MRQPLRIIILLAVTAILAACSTSRKASTPATDYSGLNGYEAIEAQYGTWQRIRVPVKFTLASPKKMEISGVATMVRDSSINISLRMFGLEVAILDIRTDSLLVVDKMNKQYIPVPLTDAIGRYGFTTANLQDLLTGRPFLMGAVDLTSAMANDFTVNTLLGGKTWVLNPKKQPRGATYAFAFHAADNTLAAVTITPDGHEPIGIPYTSAVSTPAGVFATDAHVTFSTAKADIVAVLEWNWEKARFDADVDPKPLNIGRGYKPLSLDKILNGLNANP